MAILTLNVPKVDDYVSREQMNSLCSNITFAGHNVKTITITSCVAGEGKSYLSMQIALNFAQRGKKVILIDADLRKSRMASDYAFRYDGGEIVGLAHYLSGINTLNDVLYQTNIENLSLIPEGRDISNPIPLLSTSHFQDMIRQLEQLCDLIIIDTPPVGLVVDSAEIARCTNGVIFVVNYQKTHRRELREAKRVLENAGVPILGCVLNKVEFKGITAKYYYNHYYYSHYYKKDYYYNKKGPNNMKE